MSEKKLYRIKDLANELSISESTIRYWRDRYPEYVPSVNKGKFKLYREEALKALRVIKEETELNKPSYLVEDILKSIFDVKVYRPTRQEFLSKKYSTEGELQEDCSWKLQKGGFHFEEYSKDITGFEIDILTANYCLEVKKESTPNIVYTAIGQLMVNQMKTGLKPGLVLPSDIKMRSDLRQCIKELGIEVFDEQTIADEKRTPAVDKV